MPLEPLTAEDSIRRIATRLADPMANGTRAALRRMDPAALGTPALQRLLAEAVPHGGVGADAGWALLVHCMALAAPDRHVGVARLGEELARVGFAEGRLVRLLSSSADLTETLPRTVRFLVARGGALNGRDLWELIRPALRAGPDEDALDRARTRIARDYYRYGPRADPAHATVTDTVDNPEPEATP